MYYANRILFPVPTATIKRAEREAQESRSYLEQREEYEGGICRVGKARHMDTSSPIHRDQFAKCLVLCYKLYKRE